MSDPKTPMSISSCVNAEKDDDLALNDPSSSPGSTPRSDVVPVRRLASTDALVDSDRHPALIGSPERAALRLLTRTLARLHPFSVAVFQYGEGEAPRWLEQFEAEIFESARSIVAADGVWAFASPETRTTVLAAAHRCVEARQAFDVDLTLRHATGGEHTFRCVGEAIAYDDDAVTALVAVVQEVTDQRDTSMRADRAWAQLRRTLDAIEDAYFVVDDQWRFVVVNRAAALTVGREPASLLGLALWETFPRLLGTPFEAFYREAMKARRVVRFEGCFALTGRLLEGEAYPLDSGIAVYFRDITNERSAQERLALIGAAVSQLPELFMLARMEERAGDTASSRIVFANRAFEQHFGAAPGSLVGRTIAELALWNELPHIRSWLLETAAGGVRAQADFRVSPDDQRERWIELEVSALELDAATSSESERHWLLFSRDISERKRREKDIQDSLARFRAFARATNDTVWDWDIARDDVWYNEALETTFGYDRATFPPGGSGWKDRIHPDDRRRVLAGVERALASSQNHWEDAYRFARADGTYADVLDRGEVLRDAGGVAVRAVGGLTDVTERHREKKQLFEQAALLDLARDAILLHEVDGGIRFWSRGAEAVYGYAREEVIGKSARQVVQQDEEGYEDAMRHLLAHDAWQGEVHSERKDGTRLVVESRWTLVRDVDGTPRSVLCINSDITEKKLLETHFLRAQRMESIGTLAGGIAHDLNNVLVPILMSAELLELSATDDQTREHVENVRISAQRAADMVKQVLSFARGVEGARVAVQLRHLADEVVGIARETFPKSIRVDLRFAQEPWPIIGSPTQLAQVILNLLVNARDALPHGGRVVVTLENVVLDEVYAGMNPDVAAGPYVVVKVTDNGEGIPTAIQDRVFEPFFTTKDVGKGTGLGLSTALGIVKSHHGFVRLDSETGKGTTFKLYLPASASEVVGRERVIFGGKGPWLRGLGETVLVVDDEPAIRDVMERTLTQFGYQILVAANGAEAVALYAQHRQRIDVVLTDMAMPIMDGRATVVALRAIDPSVKVIGSSGLATSDFVANAADAGLQGFIPKPYSAETVLRVLHEVLAGDEAPASSE